jgi:hypothetical protein
VAKSEKLGARIGPRVSGLLLKALAQHESQAAPLRSRISTYTAGEIVKLLGAHMHTLKPPWLAHAAEAPGLDDETRAYLRQFEGTPTPFQVVDGLMGIFGIMGAAGRVGANAIAPVVYEYLSKLPHSILDAQTAATLAAHGWVSHDWAVSEAARSGYDPTRAGWLINGATTPPGLAELLQLYNRHAISEAQLREGLAHLGLHPDWLGPVQSLSRAVLSPDVAALAVLKGWMDQGEAALRAAESGVDAEDFQILLNVNGEPPGLMQLLEAYRRGIIDEGRLHHGIRESRVRNEWVDVIEALRYTPPGYGTVLEGAVKGHLSEAEARRLVDEGGIDPQHYEWMYKATGNPPGAMEMLDLWNRGEITKERVIQALRQGHLANEYIEDVLKLKRELLPAGECVLMVESGTWPKEKAVRYLMMRGYSPEDAADYAAAGSRAKIRDDWTLGKQIVQAQYQLGVISHADAVAALQPLGYEADEAEMIVQVAKLQRIVSQQSAAMDKVRSLYTGHSIDAAAARAALAAMHVPAEEIDDILRLWTLEREANVRHLTEAQIVSAFKTGLLDQAGAQARLEQIGYTPEDAWVLLSIAAKGPLPNRPSGIVPATPQAAV